MRTRSQINSTEHKEINDQMDLKDSNNGTQRELSTNDNNEHHNISPDIQTPIGWRSNRRRSQVDRLTYAQSVELKDDAKDIDAIEKLFSTTFIDNNHPLTVMKATANSDTLYFHQAKQQNDWLKFKNAMHEEITQHIKENNFKVIRR